MNSRVAVPGREKAHSTAIAPPHPSRRDADAIKNIASLMDLALGLVDKLNASRPPRPGGADKDRRPRLHLPPEAERYFRQTHPKLLKRLKTIAQGRPTPEGTAFVRSYRDLAATLRPSSRKSDSKLAYWVAVCLLETVQYANELRERLRRIKHMKGRRDVRLELGMAYNGELSILRSRINALYRDIPRLFGRLGGNPSEDLMQAPTRAKR